MPRPSKKTEKPNGITPESGKMGAIKMAMEQISKQYGAGSIMKFGDVAANMAIEVIPTGAFPLDIALGVGGLPRGRIIEIYGPEASARNINDRLNITLRKVY
jgi:recombination protein RecA